MPPTSAAQTPSSRALDTLERIAEASAELASLHDGHVLAMRAEALLSQLPATGTIELVSTSAEGAALAAAVAAARRAPTSWRRVRLTVPADWTSDAVFLIEPVSMGTGWRRSVLRRFPRATLLTGRSDQAEPSAKAAPARAAEAA